MGGPEDPRVGMKDCRVGRKIPEWPGNLPSAALLQVPVLVRPTSELACLPRKADDDRLGICSKASLTRLRHVNLPES